MKRIKLTQGKYALINDEDYEYLNQWKWHTVKNKRTYYAHRHASIKNNKKPRLIKMHQEVAERMGIKNPDHADRDGLNNQRNNLREATRSQQQANHSLQKNSTSGYKGVYWCKNVKKWRAQIVINERNIHLGLFTDIKDAAKVYNEAAIKYFGEFAVLNKV